ncbi:hypothetical protein MKMG_02046 [Methanogenium sp. MK-MG]|nr:hypothetical protein MKMG_02046 [Methanogenium sp. MK-MG]
MCCKCICFICKYTAIFEPMFFQGLNDGIFPVCQYDIAFIKEFNDQVKPFSTLSYFNINNPFNPRL